MFGNNKKVLLLMLLVLTVWFLFPQNVLAGISNCCYYYKGTGKSLELLDIKTGRNMGDEAPDEAYASTVEESTGSPYHVLRVNFVGAKQVPSLDSPCVRVSGYFNEKKSNISSGSYSEWLCSFGEAIMRDATADAPEAKTFAKLFDAEVDKAKAGLKDSINENLKIFATKLCCVRNSNMFEGKRDCHAPAVVTVDEKTSLEIASILSKNKGKFLPDFYNYIEEIPIWKYMSCGSASEGFQYWNISCTGDQIPASSLGYNLENYKGSQAYGPMADKITFLQSDPTLYSSIFCRVANDIGATTIDIEKPNPFNVPSISGLNKTGADVSEYFGNIASALMGLIGTVALLMFIYGGFTWMTALGNGEKEKKAFQIMVWAGLGVIVILSSYAIVKFVFEGIGFM